MSGIVCMFHRDGSPASLPLVNTLTASLSFRGPNGSGVWCDGPTAMGQTLLRTTWESRDEKPPITLDGRLWLVGDARLDQRDKLIEELGRSEDDVVPDNELILRSYDRWGARCVEHLRGDFSFAIWDARTKELFGARDHFGVKPFYFSELPDLFLVSNTLNCVRIHADVSGALNDSAIADFLLFGLNRDEATTSFRDVQRLPPAHCVTVSRDAVRIRRYWSPPTNGRIRYRGAAEYVEHFETLLQSAVKDRLRARRVGVQLSGGLDSTSLASVAKMISARNSGVPEIHTYTALYESLIPDGEADYAKSAAEFLGVVNHRVSMDHLRPFVWPENTEWSLPEPPDNPFFGAVFDQFKAVAEDCRVLFSGEGSDNLMYFQMWPYVQELRRDREWKRLLHEGMQYLWVRPFPWRGIHARVAKILGKDGDGNSFPPWFAPDFARQFRLKERWREAGQLGMPSTAHAVRPKAHASLLLPQWTSMFESEDAGVTGHPVEVRYPFLDLRLVDYLLALPPFPWFFQKKLLRKAMEGKLPENVRIRRKTPFQGDPLRAHFRREDINWVNQTALNAELDRYINRGALLKLHGRMLREQVILGTRPHCLNFWLQSVRSPARNKLRVETW